MERWESPTGLTAAERRILISQLVSKANKEVLSNDKLRVGCFERTGMLLTCDGSEDDKIRPQGLSAHNLPVKVPVVVDLTMSADSPDDVITAEEQEDGWTEEDLALHSASSKIGKQDFVVEDAVESDPPADSEQPSNVW